MTRTFRAELVKILRRRVLLVTAVVVAAYAVGGAAISLAAAEPVAEATPGRGLTLEGLADAGGGTDVFRTAVSFGGVFVFVVFVGSMAVEFGRGTLRTMLLRQPRRLALLAGKVGAQLAFAAGVLAAMEAVTWAAALVLAPSQDIDTDRWLSLAAVGDGLADYAAVLVWVTGYALLGTMLAVLVRSVPLALGVGIAWAGPFEHLLQDAWGSAGRVFPGLLLEAFAAGGTPDVTAERALVTITFYCLAAAAVAGAIFTRRDVTSAG